MDPSVNLSGPNFQIGANLGQQHGPNLFHSFCEFNLSSHQSATFSGPSSVQNILSRVTGGNPSHIDGLFRSTIPNANMYFLNPYGIMFGPNARLDVQGSFHASTADYLRLDEGGRFDDKAKIIAHADMGRGDNINIVAEKFIDSPDSLVSASSRLGLDGDVNIESPTMNLDDFLVVLPGRDDEVELQFPKDCTVEDILNPTTTFQVRTVREGRLKTPEGFME